MLEQLPRSAAPSARDDGDFGVFSFPIHPSAADTLLLVARVLLGYIFLVGGWGKLTGLAGFSAYLARQGLPASYAFAVLGAVVEFFGAAALILGIGMRYAAVALIAFTLVATGIAHRFWEFDAAARSGQAINSTRTWQ